MVSTTLFTNRISNDDKLCASVSVFKNLYDSKKNIRDVLLVFINYIVREKGLHNFTAYDIKTGLFEQFYFDIPEAVIRSILRKQPNYTLANGVFSINDNPLEIDMVEIDKQITDATTNNRSIITDLLNYAKENFISSFSEDEEDKLIENLYSFLTDKSIDNKYANIVSAYIIKNENDKMKQEILLNIKEGILLYEGIKYTSDLNEIAKWNKKLNVFCDVDILFSYYGLNGSIYKDFITDLMNLINESNIKSKDNDRISLFYFSKTKKEIDNYFSKAETILEKHEPLNPSKTAMVSILTGCKNSSDIIARKAEFYSFLRSNRICEYTKMEDFYIDSRNNKYVLNSEKVVDSILEKYSEVTSSIINDYFDYLNYINALREGKRSNYIETAEYIFLTSNRKITNMAISVIPEGEYEISKAITPDYLINKLWFKLNKGLGNKVFSSINVVSKARILISSQLNSKVSENFDELQEKIKTGNIAREVAIDTLIELKKEAKNPEDITVESMNDSIEFLISDDSVEERIYQQKMLEQKLIEAQTSLNNSIIDNAEKDKLLAEKEQELLLIKKELSDKKKEDEERVLIEENKKRLFRGFVSLTVSLVIIIGLVFLCKRLENDALNSIGWIVGVVGTLITVISFLGIDINRIRKWIEGSNK